MTTRTALVTGGSGSIGAACATALAGLGHRVAITYHAHQERALATCRALRDVHRVDALALRWDGDEASTERLFGEIERVFGDVEILVNAAGVRDDASLPTMPADAWSQVLAVDLTAAFLTMRRASRRLVRRRWGRIVNVGSVAGSSGLPGQASYAAAKAGLVGLTRSAARELATRGTTANVVAAGLTDTAMTAGLRPAVRERLIAATPMRRMGTPTEIAAAVRFLCSDEASFVTGAVLPVDGGAGMGR